jgi:hypothetical protein
MNWMTYETHSFGFICYGFLQFLKTEELFLCIAFGWYTGDDRREGCNVLQLQCLTFKPIISDDVCYSCNA